MGLVKSRERVLPSKPASLELVPADPVRVEPSSAEPPASVDTYLARLQRMLGRLTIAPVDKITGPGNAYVAAAKRRVFGKVGIDMIAGPSEILVIADAENDPNWIHI